MILKKIAAFPCFLQQYSQELRYEKKKRTNCQLRMDKEDVVYIHNEILFSQNKGENPVIFDNMDAPSGH